MSGLSAHPLRLHPLRLIVTGASGRMGRMLVKAIADHPDTLLVAALDAPNSAFLGQDAGVLAGIGASGVIIVNEAGLKRLGLQSARANQVEQLLLENRRLRQLVELRERVTTPSQICVPAPVLVSVLATPPTTWRTGEVRVSVPAGLGTSIPPVVAVTMRLRPVLKPAPVTWRTPPRRRRKRGGSAKASGQRNPFGRVRKIKIVVGVDRWAV